MLIDSATIVGKHEFDMAVGELCAGKSRLADRSGFSVDQRVFGRNLRLPLHMLSDDHMDRVALISSAGDEVNRSREVRDKAMEAWVKHLDKTAVNKAAHGILRTQGQTTYEPGEWVKVWRHTQLEHGVRAGWVGPGVYLTKTPKGSLW